VRICGLGEPGLGHGPLSDNGNERLGSKKEGDFLTN
jgi:hypothetical protein